MEYADAIASNNCWDRVGGARRGLRCRGMEDDESENTARSSTSRPELRDLEAGKSGVRRLADALIVRTNVRSFEVKGNRLSMDGRISVLRDPSLAETVAPDE